MVAVPQRQIAQADSEAFIRLWVNPYRMEGYTSLGKRNESGGLHEE